MNGSTYRVSWLGDEYEITSWPTRGEGEVDPVAALWIVEDAAHDPFLQRGLLRLLEETCGWSAIDAGALAQYATLALERGLLHVRRCRRPALPLVSSRRGERRDDDAPATERAHWIEIELLDTAGQPVPYERFELRTAAGRSRVGVLDERGFARLEPLDDTSYELRFPNLAPESWQAA